LYKIRRPSIIIFLILELFTFINSYVINLKGSGIDAENFLRFAIEFAKNPDYTFQVDQMFYIQFTAFFINIFGKSEFLLAQINIIAIFLFLKELEKISIKMFNYRLAEYQMYLITLLPTVIPKITTTMREALLMLCIAVAVNVLLNSKLSFKYFVIIILGMFLHKAYAIVMIIMFLLLIFQKFHNKMNSSISFILIFSFSLFTINSLNKLNSSVVGLKPLFTLITLDSEAAKKKIDAKGSKEARTSYVSPIQFESISSVILSFPTAVSYYLFKPFIWEIKTVSDLFAFIDTIIRLIGLYALIKYFKTILRNNSNNKYALLLVGILILIWSIGTTNYGTAARHNLTTNWLFILLLGLLFNKYDRGIYNRT
jgi:hypothetical protein